MRLRDRCVVITLDTASVDREAIYRWRKKLPKTVTVRLTRQSVDRRVLAITLTGRLAELNQLVRSAWDLGCAGGEFQFEK